ncbi:MAG: histidinol-phosphate transaminase [Bacillota bacterium]|nr:histidinol-phosphate transaminase [Bacillota bacterium]
MNKYIPEKINRIEPYTPTENIYDVKLDANESYANLSWHLQKDIQKSIASIEFNRYPDPYAQKLCSKYAKCYGVNDYNVVAGNGSDELISLIINSFLNDGDKILTFTPDFSMYAFYAEERGAVNITLKKDENLQIDLKKAEKTISKENIRLVIFSNPCNPTGQGLKREKVLDFVKNVDCLVVVDEAYMDFWNESIIPEIENLPNVIILKTLSKDFGAAAVRIGFAVAQKDFIDAIKKVKSPFNVNSLSQAAGEIILDNHEIAAAIRIRIMAGKKRLEQKLSMLSKSSVILYKVIPTLTNFVLVESEKAGKIYDALLNQSVCVRNMGGFLRITAGSTKENSAFYKAFSAIVK